MGILLPLSLKPCYYIIYLYFRVQAGQKRICNLCDTNFANYIKMMASVVLVNMLKVTWARTRLPALLSFLTVTSSFLTKATKKRKPLNRKLIYQCHRSCLVRQLSLGSSFLPHLYIVSESLQKTFPIIKNMVFHWSLGDGCDYPYFTGRIWTTYPNPCTW